MKAAGREDSMKGLLGLAIGSILFTAGVGRAVPPAPGQHFDCSDGGDTSCAADDPGCVSNFSKGHIACSGKISAALAKAVFATIICHIDQAEMRFKGASVNGAGNSEENCENNPGKSAEGTLDKRIQALTEQGFCDPLQLTGAADEKAVLFGPPGFGSLDDQNGLVFCDSASGALIGDDDTGFVPATADVFKCEATVAKALAKLVVSGAKCHVNMNKAFFKGKDFDEEACEETSGPTLRGALDKFNKVRDKLLAQNICPPCLDKTGMDNVAATALAQLDAANDKVFPCGLAP